MAGLTKMQKRRASQETAQTAGDSADFHLVCFRLGAEVYGLNIMQIKEIIRHQKITPVPKAPCFIAGVINLRGMVIPVMDLRKRFELPADVNPRTMIIIAQIEKRIVGLVVDDVTDIISLPAAAILLPPGMVKGIEAEYLGGMADIKGRTKRDGELLFIIALDRLLTAEEKGSLDAPL